MSSPLRLVPPPGIRRGARALALLAGLCALASCGPGGPEQLVALEETIDFGQVCVGQEVERQIHLRNDGPQGVVLTAVTPSCPCLKADPSFQRSLGPREQGVVRVRLVTQDLHAGRLHQKFVDVLSDDPRAPRIRVNVQGEIEERVTVAPPTLRVDAADAAGKGQPRRIRIRTTTGYQVRVDRVEITNPLWFSVETVAVSEGLDALLKVSVDPARRGVVNEHVRFFVTTSGRDLPELRHELLVRIEGAW